MAPMMSSPRIVTALSKEPLDLFALIDDMNSDEDGALSVFVGKVRNHDPEAGEDEVVAIDYSAHPETAAILESIATRVAAQRVGEINRVTLIHRLGLVSVGEVVLVALVSSAHRRAGMDTVSDLVEAVKAGLPVWKKQILQDGTAVWSGLP